MGNKTFTSKQLVSTIAIAFCLFGITIYSDLHKFSSAVVVTPDASRNSQANPLAKSGNTKQLSPERPKVGTVKDMVNGDLMCYITLVDENNVKHQLGADFNICANANTYLNQKVRLSYELASINDCQSAEPCGRTRQEFIIKKMEIIGRGKPKS